MKNKFDMDRFCFELEAESPFEPEANYMACPNCESQYWEKLIKDEDGEVIACTDCNDKRINRRAKS